MNNTGEPSPIFSENTIDLIADSLIKCGYINLNSILDEQLLKDLQKRAHSLPLGIIKQAGIGRGHQYQKVLNIRSDYIHWINMNNIIESKFLGFMESLRLGLNKRLFMGLFDYEGHFSIYAKGGYYQKHIDALKGKSNRILSQVLYLNSDWKNKDAGELVLYGEDGINPIDTISPRLDTMVLFLSEKFPHEVLKTYRTRYSLSGWFRINQG